MIHGDFCWWSYSCYRISLDAMIKFFDRPGISMKIYSVISFSAITSLAGKYFRCWTESYTVEVGLQDLRKLRMNTLRWIKLSLWSKDSQCLPVNLFLWWDSLKPAFKIKRCDEIFVAELICLTGGKCLHSWLVLKNIVWSWTSTYFQGLLRFQKYSKFCIICHGRFWILGSIQDNSQSSSSNWWLFFSTPLGLGKF